MLTVTRALGLTELWKIACFADVSNGQELGDYMRLPTHIAHGVTTMAVVVPLLALGGFFQDLPNAVECLPCPQGFKSSQALVTHS